MSEGRTTFYRLATGAVALVAAAAIAACGGDDGGGDDSAAATEDPIVIGFAIGRSGFMTQYDTPPREAAQIAIDELNADGGILGRKIEVVESDTKSQTDLLASAGLEVLDDGADFVVTSCDFDQGGPAASAAQQRGIVAMSPCAGSTKFGPGGIGPLAFTMGSAGSTQGIIMAEWALEERDWTSVYVIANPTFDYHRQMEEAFRKRWEELGGKILGQDKKLPDDQSVAPLISRIRRLAEPPDTIFIADGNPSLGVLTRQLRAAGIDIPIISGGENYDGEAWKDGVPNATNIYFSTYSSIYGDDPDPKVNEFYERYRQEVGDDPPSGAAVTGYATIQALAKAAEKAGSIEGEAVGAALQEFHDEELLAGPTTFTAELHIALQRTARIMQIQDGKTSFVALHTPKAMPDVEG